MKKLFYQDLLEKSLARLEALGLPSEKMDVEFEEFEVSDMNCIKLDKRSLQCKSKMRLLLTAHLASP